MTRDLDSGARERDSERAIEQTRPIAPRDERWREHALYEVRGSAYRLSPAELATMYDVGRFRTVALEDLARHRYAGRARDLGNDVRALAAQGLVQMREIWTGPRSKALRVLVLTKLGREALEKHGPHESVIAREWGTQALYSGLVKRNEIRHDAAIYAMFQAKRELIERAGGRIRRIVLDFELKRRVYAPLAKAKALPPADYARLQEQVARLNGLKVIQGKIPLPDLRVEYETRSGESAQADLELATQHYHGRALAEKAQAGFGFYAADGSGAKLSRVLEERDITVAILSL
jgi:hypothetical protein